MVLLSDHALRQLEMAPAHVGNAIWYVNFPTPTMLKKNMSAKVSQMAEGRKKLRIAEHEGYPSKGSEPAASVSA